MKKLGVFFSVMFLLMQRGPLERRVDNVIELVHKRKRGDDGDDEVSDGDSSPPVSRQRRASILPDTVAYNEAIMASLDAVDLDDDRSDIPDSPGSPPYTVNEPPDDDSVDESVAENVSVE